jgi:hypothetical protein
MRFARLIHRPLRVLGGTALRTASGGNLKPPWSPRKVALLADLQGAQSLRAPDRNLVLSTVGLVLLVNDAVNVLPSSDQPAWAAWFVCLPTRRAARQRVRLLERHTLARFMAWRQGV